MPAAFQVQSLVKNPGPMAAPDATDSPLATVTTATGKEPRGAAPLPEPCDVTAVQLTP